MAKEKKNGNKEKLTEAVLTDVVEISPDVFVISFKRNFEFLPGQVIKIGLGADFPPRIYSICSGSSEENISVLFNVKMDGYLTPKLAALIPGETIFISEPYGTFTGNEEPAWWIATGTGVAPFLSMLRSELCVNKKLIHGVKFLNQFYFEDEFDSSLSENYIRCCSREKSCDVFPGRVTDYLKTIEKFPKNNKYFLCGKALMVVETRDLLIGEGVPFENILSEIFF